MSRWVCGWASVREEQCDLNWSAVPSCGLIAHFPWGLTLHPMLQVVCSEWSHLVLIGCGSGLTTCVAFHFKPRPDSWHCWRARRAGAAHSFAAEQSQHSPQMTQDSSLCNMESMCGAGTYPGVTAGEWHAHPMSRAHTHTHIHTHTHTQQNSKTTAQGFSACLVSCVGTFTHTPAPC